MSVRPFASLLLTVLLAACAQTEGEVCEIDDDCEGDLTCCVLGRVTVPDASVVDGRRGICRTVSACELAQIPDAAPTPDAAPGDSGPPVDAAPEEDAAPSTDDAGSDAGAEEDAGAEPDAGSDAGATADGGSDDAGLDSGP